MKQPQILQSSCCSSTRCLALSVWTLSANSPTAHPPAIKHKTREKMLKKHLAMLLSAWGRLNSSSLLHSLQILGVQPVDANNKERHRGEACVWQKEKGCTAEKRGKEGGFNYMHPIFFSFLFCLCDSSCSHYRLSASPWLLLLFIALLMTIAVSSTDLLASYIQWEPIKLIPNSV